MKKEKPNKDKREHGITLISLIIMVILLIILSVVSIKAITGGEGILKVSSDATEDYNILQYKEQIEQLRESIILKAEISGESINLEKLSREMTKEAIWIKSAVANIKEGASELNNDIIVITTDGYIFQLYYSDSYGQKFIEYLGREDGNAIPEVTILKENNRITVQAVEDNSGINRIEIIYKGDVIKSEKSSRLEYDAPKTGWYTIRVVSNKGKLRYMWVRVSSTLVAPKIEIVEPTIKPASGWYKDKVTVRISALGDKVSKIYYTTSRWKENPILEIKETDLVGGIIGKDIEITLQGVTNIYAYTIDGNDGESEIVRQDVLIDSEPPVINDIQITGTKGENGWYRGEVGISIANAKDNASGIAGYYYYIPTAEEITSNFIPEINQMLGENGQVGGSPINITKVMKIVEDGIKTVIIRLQDKAGNISAPVTVTAKKDNTPPDTPELMLKEETIRMREATLRTTKVTDIWSSVTYEYYIIKNDEIEDSARLVGTTKSTEYTVTGLEPSTTYTAYVIAKDEAGNVSEKSNRVIIQTRQEITRPIIKITKGEKRTKRMV